MKNPVRWLRSSPENVLEVEFMVHHAPVYLTTIETGQILDYEYPIDTPSMPDEDITISVTDSTSVKKQVQNSKKVQKKTVSESPYSRSGDLLIPLHSAVVYSRDGFPNQYIKQLQNGEFVVFDTNLNEFIAPHPRKVRDKLRSPDIDTQRVPVSVLPISERPIMSKI